MLSRQNSNPNFTFKSEAGLRVFVEHIDLSGSKTELINHSDFSSNDAEGNYEISFNESGFNFKIFSIEMFLLLNVFSNRKLVFIS